MTFVSFMFYRYVDNKYTLHVQCSLGVFSFNTRLLKIYDCIDILPVNFTIQLGND